MPELPEVEIVASALHTLIRGNKILQAKLMRKKLAPNETAKSFASKLTNTEIKSVNRRGKHILFELDNKRTLITHLRMTGRFQMLNTDNEDPKFTHAVFYLKNDNRLVFSDQRHFGFMQIVENINLSKTKELASLAPEPFSKEFSASYLKKTLKSSSRKIKELILDQTKVCGLGNIYTSEALFKAKIHPQKPANQISTYKVKKLHKFIIEVMQESIAYGSTLHIDPQNLEKNYYGGSYENHWCVYDQEGNHCPNCKNKIKRIKQSGRSSYYCPSCQKI